MVLNQPRTKSPGPFGLLKDASDPIQRLLPSNTAAKHRPSTTAPNTGPLAPRPTPAPNTAPSIDTSTERIGPLDQKSRLLKHAVGLMSLTSLPSPCVLVLKICRPNKKILLNFIHLLVKLS